VVSRHHDVQLLPATRSQKTEATSSVLFALESIAPGRATGGAIRGGKKKPLEDHDRDEGEAGRDHRWAGVNAGDYVKD
jgi:hypothetical protein